MVTIAKLPAKTEAEIRYLIESCGFANATEVVIEAVHQLAQREKPLADLRAKVQIGIDELDRGEGIAYTPELMSRIRAKAHELAVSRSPLDPDVCEDQPGADFRLKSC